MKKIFIRLPSTGKIYTYDARDREGKALRLKTNESVLVETDQVIEEGKVVEELEMDSDVEEGTGVIIRALNQDDYRQCFELKNVARQYIEEAQAKTSRYGLGMQILDADLSFDQKKLTFYFSANGRVDFRGLVLDMAKSFNKLIRLQQVGMRDEAKYFGGIGKCGRELCCSKFLNNPETVTLEMAQNQISAAGGSKSTGCCGKLMCCLAYEAEEKISKKKKI